MKKYLIFGLSFLYATPVMAGLSEDYTNFKNKLSNDYGLSYNLDYSIMPQRTSPHGKKTSWQSLLAPSIAWTTFNNEYGTGTLNASYYSVYYNDHNANDIQGNAGLVTPINDYGADEQEFADLYYTYQLPAHYNWLTFGAGQYSVYNFDGTDYNSNQQINFINYALSQNASATYSDAGLGAYVQATPGNWLFVAGALDATNIEAPSIRFNHIDKGHFTSFAQIGYNPDIHCLGKGQYSVLLYNQPYVHEQQQTTNGWSFNAQQNMSEKTALFARINGVTGEQAEVKQSYVLGGVYNNPLDRNELDQIGLAYAYDKIDADAVGEALSHSVEHVIEAYWAWGISKWATLTPDIQFYIHPALNQNSTYGTATSLRLTIMF